MFREERRFFSQGACELSKGIKPTADSSSDSDIDGPGCR